VHDLTAMEAWPEQPEAGGQVASVGREGAVVHVPAKVVDTAGKR
jgi:hypothetical protein